MADKTIPQTNEQAPDPAVHFDRSDPKRESGAGRLTNNSKATPAKCEDKMASAVSHAQDGSTQVNADDAATIAPKPERPDVDRESLGWEKKKKA